MTLAKITLVHLAKNTKIPQTLKTNHEDLQYNVLDHVLEYIIC